MSVPEFEPAPSRAGNVTDEIPESGSLALARSLNVPVWVAFSQSRLFAAS